MFESSEILVCPGCGEPADPTDSLCPSCGYHHLGRLSHLAADEPPVEAEVDPAESPEAQADTERSLEEGEATQEGPATLLFTYVCPNPTCQRVNKVFNEDHNGCFNCGQELWLSREARKARWYEEHGRRLERDEEIGFMISLFLCAILLLGLGMLVGCFTQAKVARRDRRKGERMNQEAGRPLLARSDRRFGGLSGGEYWVNLGPDPEDRPDDYDPEVSRRLDIFTRYYFRGWLVTVLPAFIVVLVLSN